MEYPNGRDPVARQHRHCKVFGSGAAKRHSPEFTRRRLQIEPWHKEGRAKRGFPGGTSMRAVARPSFPERCPRFFSSRRMHEDTLLTIVSNRGSGAAEPVAL